MPKYEIIHSAGIQVNNEIKDILNKYFKESDILKLERLGGRITISLTTPFIKKISKKNKKIIYSEFITELNELKNSPQKLFDKINNLSVKQLREIAKILNQPLRSNLKAAEIKAELVKWFQSEMLWKGISDK